MCVMVCVPTSCFTVTRHENYGFVGKIFVNFRQSWRMNAEFAGWKNFRFWTTIFHPGWILSVNYRNYLWFVCLPVEREIDNWDFHFVTFSDLHKMFVSAQTCHLTSLAVTVNINTNHINSEKWKTRVNIFSATWRQPSMTWSLKM